MTRVLSDLLNAREPMFQRYLAKLEAASGRPSHDVRLTSEILQTTQTKLRELGLDPHDTTGSELYAALKSRIKSDDERLSELLAARFADKDIDDDVGALAHVLQEQVNESVFALKSAVAKKLLKGTPPKKVMKLLGYRSLDSMLKHEHVASLLAAGLLVEAEGWRHQLIEKYRSLKPKDFEMKPLTIEHPSSKRWQTLAAKVVTDNKHAVLGLNEFGTVVLLPLPDARPAGSLLTMLALGAHACNDVRASATFLKLCQVQSNFAALVQMVADGEPLLDTKELDEPMAWKLVQRYYGRAKHLFDDDLFAPHIQLDDLSWQPLEALLSRIDPALEFWHGTAHLSLVHDHQAVSLNLLDACLNYCNDLPYANRIVHHFRDSLWHELMLRYLKHNTVEMAVMSHLQSGLALESATA